MMNHSDSDAANEARIQAEVSLYPLRCADLSEPIAEFCRIVGSLGACVDDGPMSAIVSGSIDEVFNGLKAGVKAVARDGDVVVVIKASNACPTGEGNKT